MIRNYLYIAFCIVSFTGWAQYSEVIKSPRPGKSFGPFTTGAGVFQIMTGANFNSSRNEASTVEVSGFNYLTSMRFGIAERFEVRYAFRLNQDQVMSATENITKEGLSASIVGVRYNLLNAYGDRKISLGLQADVNLNAFKTDYKKLEPEPRLILLHGQKLLDRLTLTSNWGVLRNGNIGTYIGTYSLDFSFPVHGKFSAFVENYGNLNSGDLDTHFDTGLAFLVNDNLLLDVSAGYGQNDGFTDTFVDFGLSWKSR